jgi:hypothetical protein
MSFAQPPPIQPPKTDTLGLSHFGPSAIVGTEQSLDYSSARRSPVTVGSGPLENIHAPQGRVPLTVPSIAAPLVALRSDSRPDFARGFGLDIPEEEEPQELVIPNDIAEGVEASLVTQEASTYEMGHSQETEVDGTQDEDGLRTASQSRYHSRHVSRLSTAFSLPVDDVITEACKEGDMVPLRNAIPVLEIDDLDQDAAGEWTGSEDLYLGGGSETSEDEVFFSYKFCLYLQLNCMTYRASESGPILQTKRELVIGVSIAACVAVLQRSSYQEDFLTSLVLRTTQ